MEWYDFEKYIGDYYGYEEFYTIIKKDILLNYIMHGNALSKFFIKNDIEQLHKANANMLIRWIVEDMVEHDVIPHKSKHSVICAFEELFGNDNYRQ